MGFFEIEVFLRTAECDTAYAAAVLGCTELDVCLSVEKLQKSIPVSLFSEPLRPSKNNLTNMGKVYVEYVKAALFGLHSGILDILNREASIDNYSKLTLSLYQTIGKELLIDSLISLLDSYDFHDVHLDIVTPNSNSDNCPLKFHAIFGRISPNYKSFFQTRWYAVITQGLYASKNYIADLGAPKTVDDLINHTVIVCGNSFCNIMENDNNWHLRSYYGIPRFVPSIVVSNQPSLSSAINADLGIGPSFCHQSQHLQRVLPWISGPVSMLEFAVRVDIIEKLNNYIDAFDTILQSHLRSSGIEIMSRIYEDEN